MPDSNYKYLDSEGLLYFWQKIKAAFVGSVQYDSTNNKFTQTKNGSTTDIVTLSTMKTAMNFSKSDIGLGNVDNTADANKTVSAANTLTNAKFIDGITFNGSAAVKHFGTCTTSGSTAAKVATVGDNFTLDNGSIVLIHFSQTDTVTDRNSVTLNVNNTGARKIYYRNGKVDSNVLMAYGIYMFVYQGAASDTTAYWELVAQDIEISSYAGTATPLMDGTAATGTSSKYAKEDHVHPKDTSKANLASPTFTGTPKAPTATAGTNTTQIATTAFVTTAISNAISGISGISFQVVSTLPATGEVGVIYLIAHTHGTRDVYDEYVWTGTVFEKLGSTDVDLSGYVQSSQLVAITNSEIDTIVAS